MSEAIIRRLAELHAEEKQAAAVLKDIKQRKRSIAETALSHMIETGTQRLTCSVGEGNYTVYLKQLNYPKLKEGFDNETLKEILADEQDPTLRSLLTETYNSRSLAVAMREIVEQGATDEHPDLFNCVELSSSTEVAVRAS